MLLALPFGVWGALQLIRSGDVLGKGLFGFAAMTVTAWVAVNFLGLVGNASMKRALGFRLDTERPDLSNERFFVGLATPKHRGMLDPHEDVGFILLGNDSLEVYGDTLRLTLGKSEIETIRFRPNVHSMVGLGRWISIEGTTDGVKFRLNLEPRERNTLLGNRAFGKVLLARLQEWSAQNVVGAPEVSGTP